MLKSIPLAAGAALLVAGTAFAAVPASTTADLNMRSGPGTQYPVMHVIAANDAVSVETCATDSKWCMVMHNGATGWVYSDYLAGFSGQTVTLGATAPAPVTAVIAADTENVGTATGYAFRSSIFMRPAADDALVAVPASTVTLGAVSPAPVAVFPANQVTPPLFVQTYIRSAAQPTVFIDGDIFVGAMLPLGFTLYEVPTYQYDYAYVNGRAVLVDPGTRQIVYVAA
jgi:uncharacterized protein YraI